jgi:D-alanyl-lipoteichoic acid acyltransferase DltB (MBOAT superfamily)
MLFNSLNFAIFLPVVFILYWFATKGKTKQQNILLLVSSYFFYACWDWQFMFLLIFSTLLDYFSGIKIHEALNIKSKKIWLWLSIGINLGFLGVFKYYNFFAESFAEGLSLLGFKANLTSLQVILPVGISFYTFHGLSYVIDIYKNRIHPEKNFIAYSVFVSFFPLLVAGPIERATHLLPQILKKRSFDYTKAIYGLRQILWGLFKKIVIADNCAEFANIIFNNSSEYSGSTLLLGALFFTFQIYCDFSGYSDIAKGTARLFGIELLKNFAFPYFSRDIAEFWRRWHISLSSWFKDYLYIPLGGSKGGTWLKIRNTFIIFIVSGFWHGANWTFIIWGFLNALYIMPSIILNTNRINLDIVAKGKYIPSINEFLQICLTFSLTVFAWIFFRAINVSHAFSFISEIFSNSLFKLPNFPGIGNSLIVIFLTCIFILIEWVGREQEFALNIIYKIKSKYIRVALYYVIILTILFCGNFSENQFIYFQF